MKRADLLPAARRQRGATMVEFAIVSFLVLGPIILAILQLGLFMVAKNTVNTAALGVARAGAATGGDPAAMRGAFATGIVPLYAASGMAALGADKEVTAGNYPVVYAAARERAFAATLKVSPVNRITVLNPTSAAFKDFGVKKPGVGIVIPHTNMDFEHDKVGAASGQTRSDALLLKIELRYCYAMVMPVIDDIIAKINMNFLSGDMLDNACYAKSLIDGRRGIPIKSQAVVRMTVAPVGKNFP